jgi:16S rRNA (cytidine1402-2'-O)-methyltransferase
MIRQLSYRNDQPTLYLIATPIGNLEDITMRALRMLKEVDVIFAEDTRVTAKLLRHYNIEKPLKSYHDHNKELMGPTAMEYFLKKQSIGLVSDAGTPLMNDPGFELVLLAKHHGYNVVALPGPSALLTALAVSGIQPHPFVFYGFLPNRKQKRLDELKRYQDSPDTLVFYESPHRMQDTLHEMARVLGDRNAYIGRELTKIYEEAIHGRLLELAQIEEWIGELVIVVAPKDVDATAVIQTSLVDAVDLFIENGLSKSDAIKQVAKERNLTKSVVYAQYHADVKSAKEES